MSEARYTVAVRELCAFTAKHGDLDMRFTPSPSAQEGIAGHQVVAARRGPGYETELSLAAGYDCLHVRGRADGYDPALNQLEEIKTHRGDLKRVPENHRQLHWAQLYLYGAMLCEMRSLDSVTLALVYFDITTQQETVFQKEMTHAALQEIFAHHCQLFLQWAQQELAHRNRRDAALRTLAFPYPFRAGQRDLASAVYRTFRSAGVLLAQAPTGIGKTLGTLFPALKAMPEQLIDKLFFLTAKTPGRQLALDAMPVLGRIPVRTLELVARDKRCEHPGKACHGDACPLAAGFYDRLPSARSDAAARGFLDQAALDEVAREHRVCPYYLSLEMARWCDVIVGDYNYYFDLGGFLLSLTQENSWRIGLLVDEAHNLVDRARDMYSVTLAQASLTSLQQTVPAILRRPLATLLHQWEQLDRQHWPANAPDGQADHYLVLDGPPEDFLNAVRGAVSAISEYRNAHPTQQHAALLEFYFQAAHFCRMVEALDKHFITDLSLHRGAPLRLDDASGLRSDICLRNLVPAPLLQRRLDAAHATILFSATLAPPRFYLDMFGLPPTTSCLDISAPFNADQLRVTLVPRSTRFRHRARSVQPIAALIAEQFQAQPGNYLAFFPSFDYLEQVRDALGRSHPALPLLVQSRGMAEPARQAFLARFTPASAHIGFAVLGGAFGEGVDLPGTRLIGTFITSLGMPQVNPVNEQMRVQLQQLFGDADGASEAIGHDYTYYYPGLRKVVQAAGRVIRTPQDTGVVYLIDDRFDRPKSRALLPRWWQLERRQG